MLSLVTLVRTDAYLAPLVTSVELGVLEQSSKVEDRSYSLALLTGIPTNIPVLLWYVCRSYSRTSGPLMFTIAILRIVQALPMRVRSYSKNLLSLMFPLDSILGC